MARFIFIYRGEATDLAEMSPSDAAAVLAKWGTWRARVGSALADLGTPFGPGISVVDDGSTRDPLSLTGYSIVEASSLEEAQALVDGHPYLSAGSGDYSIDIYPLLSVPFQD